MIPALGEMKMHSSSSTPVTTLARPVRAPAPTPALLSMNVVFDEAEKRPPTAATSLSTASVVRMRGRRP